MTTSRSFPSEPASTRSARHFVLNALGDLPSEVRDAVAIMVGELAMNAVEHACTDFQVTVELADGTVRVTVTDSGGSQPAAGPMPPAGSLRGRGLPIVHSLADDWGVVPSSHGPGKTIWFEIAVSSPASLALPEPRFGRARVAWKARPGRSRGLAGRLDPPVACLPTVMLRRAWNHEAVLKNRSWLSCVRNLECCAELGVLPRCR
ncbi:MAG TPA: ATP-binding protein [Trebonia sp.]|nr:ATP-binding protein [Trebonia sp.]